jgi:hypothetical protein
MTARPLTLRWSPPPRAGRTLFVVFAYHGRDGDGSHRGVLERPESPAARGHRIVHRDHYANPRPLEYSMALVASAMTHTSPAAAPDLVVDRQFEISIASDVTTWFGQVATANVADSREWTAGKLADAHRYDNVVLVYSDALGLGCDAGEKMALRGRDSILIVNGRRRAFRLTRALRVRLRLSRWLAHTRVVERILARCVPPFAATLAWADKALGKW